ncbi:MAG TPA: histone deacetylase family protein [Alphaproteobacteria bacterium]|nr:histone deacetylase family protein [Alphaproteobacteria bacterium]
MTTLIFTHPACLEHNPGPGHPESPRRLEAVLEALHGPGFAGLVWREARRASTVEIERVHSQAYVAQIMHAVPEVGRVNLDLDTALSPGSGEAALRAAGAVCGAVDAVAAGEGRNAFCPVRPPGHHAERDRALGFCLFNNIAIGALHARAVHGYRRVAVIDFDVHHGNGTQDSFAADPELFYASTHQWPAYPGTGAADERGVGNIVNVPLESGAGSAEFRAAMSRVVLPALAGFAPDFVLVSAGFDAHANDPLASLELHEDDYSWITAEIAKIAGEHCAGRVVSALEGGYDIRALADSAAAHVAALMAA